MTQEKRGKWMDWVWGGLFLLVVAAQALGMAVGRPLSKVVGRLSRYSLPASIFAGMLFVWLPSHWFLGRSATSVTTEDWLGIVLGGILGLLAHRRWNKE
jgi:hypothetical protein